MRSSCLPLWLAQDAESSNGRPQSPLAVVLNRAFIPVIFNGFHDARDLFCSGETANFTNSLALCSSGERRWLSGVSTVTVRWNWVGKVMMEWH